MKKIKAVKIGDQIHIVEGARVYRGGVSAKRTKATVVTVREITTKLSGVTTLSWKSHGRLAHIIVK